MKPIQILCILLIALLSVSLAATATAKLDVKPGNQPPTVPGYLVNSISGLVYWDFNADGIQNNWHTYSSTAIPNTISGYDQAAFGYTVYLFKKGKTLPVASFHTDFSGKFTFSKLPAGTYTVSMFDLPDGWYSSTVTTKTFTIPSKGVHTVDFGIFTDAKINGRCYWDQDGDKRFDSVEQGIPGILVRCLDLSKNVVTSTYTDVDGNFELTTRPGTYTLDFVTPKGWILTYGPDSADADGQITTASGWTVTTSPHLEEGNYANGALDAWAFALT